MCILEDVANECAGSVRADVGVRPLCGSSLGILIQVVCVAVFYFSFTDEAFLMVLIFLLCQYTGK